MKQSYFQLEVAAMSVLEIVRRHAGTAARCCIAMALALSFVAPVLAQDDGGPIDDPYVKVPYTSTTKAPAITGDKTGGGSTDSVTINTIDPLGFPQICTYVTVTHNGETPTGLDPDSFCVSQDGIVIDSFTVVEQTADSCITRICLVIDRSGSMSDGGKLTAAKNAAKRFIRNMGPLDRAAVVSFGNCWTVNQNFTSDTTLLIAAVNSLTASGRTAALDGIWKGLDLTKLESGTNKAVIALSDGMENWSQNCGSGLPDGLTDPQGFTDDLNFLDSIAAAIGAPVYTISLGTDFDPDYLQDIANATGGEYHHAPTTATLDAIYDAIKLSICTRYLICYTSPDTIANGDCHTVVICRDNADGDKTGLPDCFVCDTGVYCEPYPPVITIEVDPACRRWGQPVELCATVTDSDTPPESLTVKLYYRIFEPGGSYTEISPTRNGNEWCYTIPAAMIPCGKDSIEFYFTATDGNNAVASPFNAPSSSHQVTICQNSPPTCEFGPDLAPPVCNPVSPIDFVPLNLSDIDGNKANCYLYGDGQLVSGGWQNDNVVPGDTAYAYIVCFDSCGDSCNIEIERIYPERELIPCNIPDGGDTTFFLCDPGQIVIPVTGGPGSGCEIISGAGELINGEWRWNATKDTVITFVIQCVSLCDSCHSTYTVNINVNEPPICGESGGGAGGFEPSPSGTLLCDSVNFSDHFALEFKSVSYDGNNSTWCYELTWDGVDPELSHLTIELCDSLTQANFVSSSPAGASIGPDGSTGLYGLKWDTEDLPNIPANTPVQFCFTINRPLAVAQSSFVPKAGQNEDIVDICGPSTDCARPNGEPNPAPCDTTVFLCDSGEVCVPFASSDPDGNLELCRIVSGPGALVNGQWCFYATASGTYYVTIECLDSCNASCEQTLCATVVIDEVPVVTCPPDTTFECDDVVNYGTPTVVDGGFSPATLDVFKDSIPGNCPDTYTLRIRYIASDTCGHADTCVQSVQVIDTTAPEIACPDPAAYSCESVPADFPAPPAVDNCDPNPVVTKIGAISTPSSLCPQEYSMSIFWEARDACGNADTCVQSIFVYDSTPPVVTCPPDTTLSCTDEFPIPDGLKGITPGADIKGGTPYWPFGIPSATDNCDDSLILYGQFGRILDNDSCNFVFEVLYYAEDNCGNKDTCTQIVTVVDTLDPVIECPEPTRYECNSIPTSFPAPGAKDACNSVTVTEIDRYRDDSTCAYEYTLVIVWEAKDKCGNADTCKQLVHIYDDTPPVLTIPQPITYNCDSVPAEFPMPTAQDQCDPNPRIDLFDVDTIVTGCVTEYGLQWVATDACGNFTEPYTQIVIVLDRTAPVITCPDPLLFECDSVPPIDSLPKPTVVDNCDDSLKIERFLASSTNAECPQGYHMTILWVATDDCGNADSCTQVINVVDTTAPALVDCDTLIVFECTIYNKDAQSISPVLPTATDNCDPTPEVRYYYGPSGGTWGCDYYITFGIYAVDDCDNYSDTCFQTIRVIDTTPPEIVCPDSLIFECPIQPTLLPPVATDNCPGYAVPVIAIGYRVEDSTCYGSYRWVITWEATDHCGLKDTCEQVIRFRDTTPPSFTQGCPSLYYECDEVPHIFAAPPAGDLCDPQVDVALIDVGDTTFGDCPQRYYFNLYWEAKDDCGNADTCAQTVYVLDTTAPVVSCPPDTTISCDEFPEGKAADFVVGATLKTTPVDPWPFGVPGAKDNCDESPEIYATILGVDGSYPCNWYVAVGYYAVDSCGNVSDTCRQIVTVRDTTPPVVTCPPDSTFECDDFPDEKSLTVGQEIKSTPNGTWPYGTPTGSDNCSDSVYIFGYLSRILSQDPCSTVFEVGYIGFDVCQNSDTCFQLVTIVDTTAPVLTCPDTSSVLCSQIPTFWVPPQASDNCSTPIVGLLGEPRWGYADCPIPDTIVLTWVAVDRCENADTCEQRIFVIDNTPPLLVCEPLSYECDELPAEWPKPGVKDDCDANPTVTLLGVSDTTQGACPQRYLFTITWEAMDECGNRDTCEQTVFVIDTTGPVTTCPNDTIIACQDIPPGLLSSLNTSQAVPTTSPKSAGDKSVPIGQYPFGTPTAVDNCDPLPVIYWYVSSQDGVFPCHKYFTIGYWSVDACGNAGDTCFQSVQIVDTIAPVVTCPPDTTVDCTFDFKSLTIGEKLGPEWPYGMATATDNCDPNPAIDGPTFTGYTYFDSCGYEMIIRFIATDQCGLADTCLQYVEIVDTIPPVITCPNDTTVQCALILGDPKSRNLGDWAAFASTVKDEGGEVPPGLCFLPATDLCDPEAAGCLVGFDIIDSLCPLIVDLKWVARDRCGNESDTCHWIITLVDTIAPKITCPPSGRIACSALRDGVFDGDSLGWPTAADDCDTMPEILLLGYTRLSEDCPYIVRRAFVAVDTCGNISDTCYQDITVYDEDRPQIVCPEGQFFECDVDTTLFAWPTATDSCDPDPTIELILYSKDQIGQCSYVLVRAWHAYDDCGNYSDTCRQVITVGDTTDPVITCPPDTIVDCSERTTRNGEGKAYLDAFANGSVSKDAQGCYDYDFRYGTPTATDNCDDTLHLCLGSIILTDADSCRWVYTLTFVALDDCANISDTCTQRVIFTDTTPPVVVCAPDTTVYCANNEVPPCFGDTKSGKTGEKFVCDFRLIDTLYDACDANIEYQYELSYHFEACPQYIRAKIWAVDDCGNISDTCLWTVYFDDTTAPVIACPLDINAECGTDPGNWGWPTATDDCGQPAIALIDQDTVAQNSCYLEVVRWFEAKDFCGNADTCRQLIVIGDSTDPVITCPTDTVVSCDEIPDRDSKAMLAALTSLAPKGVPNPCDGPYGEYDYRYGRPTVTDNCSEYYYCLIDVNEIYTDSCRTTFELLFGAIDACGNSDTCTQRVSFIDKGRPVIVCATDTTIYCDRDKANCIELKGTDEFKLGDEKFLCGFRMVDTVYDGCCEDVEVFCRLTYHLNQCPAYIRAFIWAKDCCGNYSDTCDWRLNIADTSAPVITCPPNLTFECDDKQTEWGWPTATDNCDDVVSIDLVSEDTTEGDCGYIITRTFSAEDRCHNESRCQQTIEIDDTTAPVCNLPNDTTIFICEPGQQICLPVSATDNCDQSVECAVIQGTGTVANGFWCFTPTASGPYSAVIACQDDCGNRCSDQVDVTVKLNSAPECHLPNDTTIYLCDPADIVLYGYALDADGNLVDCEGGFVGEQKASMGSGAADSSVITISITGITEDWKACIWVRCYDSCGAECIDTFCVTIDITEKQECYQTPDTTVTLCNPEEICILYDWLDPVVKTSDVVRTPVGGKGKGKYSAPQQVPNQQNSPVNKTLYDQCVIAQGPGELKGDYWCWTPPDYDTVVTVRIICGDTCFHTCTNEFTVTYNMNEGPVCSLLVDLVDPICTPDTDFVPYLSIGEGGTECYLVGPGELVSGGWQYANPVPGTSVNVKIVCADTCGDSCVIDFTRNYPERVPVECRVPDDIDTLLCQPATLSFPVGSTEGAECTVVSGPGSIDVGQWFYYADRDTSFCVTIECKSLCDSCRSEFCVTIEMNDPPVCELPNDTSFFLCDTATVCLPVTAFDSNGNFSYCTIDYDKSNWGWIENGMWCYFASYETELTVPVICFDSCGAYCRGEFTVTFNFNEPPVCELPNDTTIFLCDPATVCLPIGATDVDGNFSYCDLAVPSKTNGDGYIQNGQWCFDVTGDTVITAHIVCYDSCGAACYDYFTVTFIVNDAPICDEVSDTAVFLCEPTPVCLPFGSKDTDGNLSHCQVISGPGTYGQGKWCFTPTSSGVYNVTIRCTDSCGAYCDESFAVTVDMNDPPVCFGPPVDTTIFLCEPTNVCVGGWGATDPDNNLSGCVILDDDKRFESVSGVPLEWCDFISTDQTVLLTLECTDSCGATCTRDVYIHFVMNLPPVINLGADISTQVGDGQVCFNYTVSDPDNTSPLTEQLLLFPAGAVIDTAANTICWTPEEGGNFMFVGQVIDSCGATDFDTAFVLVSQPQPPVCQLPGDTTIFQCAPAQINRPVSATSLHPPVNCQVIAGYGTVSGGFWRFTPPGPGVYSATIQCTDAVGGQCQGSFQVTVLGNTGPTCNVRDTSVFLCDPGSVCIPVSGTDPDGGAVTCTKISGPGTLTNGIWCYNATADANFTVTFRCTDACGAYCEKTVTININMNESPTCSFPFNQTVILCPGDMICFGLQGSDPDGNFSICGIKDGLGEVLPTGPNGSYEWCYKPTGSGVVPVTVYCADACGDTCFSPRQFTVLFNTPQYCGTQPQGQVIHIGPAAIVTGDVNGSGEVNIADLALLTAIVNQWNVKGKTATLEIESAAAGYQYKADVNCDDKIDHADIAYLMEYLFSAGPAPCAPDEE